MHVDSHILFIIDNVLSYKIYPVIAKSERLGREVVLLQLDHQEKFLSPVPNFKIFFQFERVYLQILVIGNFSIIEFRSLINLLGCFIHLSWKTRFIIIRSSADYGRIFKLITGILINRPEIRISTRPFLYGRVQFFIALRDSPLRIVFIWNNFRDSGWLANIFVFHFLYWVV